MPEEEEKPVQKPEPTPPKDPPALPRAPIIPVKPEELIKKGDKEDYQKK